MIGSPDLIWLIGEFDITMVNCGQHSFSNFSNKWRDKPNQSGSIWRGFTVTCTFQLDNILKWADASLGPIYCRFVVFWIIILFLIFGIESLKWVALVQIGDNIYNMYERENYKSLWPIYHLESLLLICNLLLSISNTLIETSYESSFSDMGWTK